MKPILSVIVCSHNPSAEYLSRVFDALKNQTLSVADWELILVDNLSSPPLESVYNLNWHPQARIIKEKILGVTHARLTGIGEGIGDFGVFVDDDNILDKRYLEKCVSLAESWPQLGAWSGRVVPEFEVEPPAFLRSHLWRICIRDIKQDSWGNTGEFATIPWGAGMCTRMSILKKYLEKSIKISTIIGFSRKGGDFLASGEDVDIAMTAIDMGYGVGVFSDLELTHLIPERRITTEYFLKLIEDSAAGEVILQHKWKNNQSNGSQGFVDLILKKYKIFRAKGFERKVGFAIERGVKRGRNLLKLSQKD